LLAARDEAVVAERCWRLRRVTVDRVLDERGTTGPDAVGWIQTRDKVRGHTARAEVEIARELESLPAISAAAERGELSFDQLEHLVAIATAETDAECARRGAAAAPSDLARIARRQRSSRPQRPRPANVPESSTGGGPPTAECCECGARSPMCRARSSRRCSSTW
jgi:hypothetical protein